MALQRNINLNSGIQITNGYSRIDSISGSKNGITFTLNSYLNRQAYENGKEYIEHRELSFIPSVKDNSSNWIKQSYNYLKTLEEFKDAVDLLDEGQVV